MRNKILKIGDVFYVGKQNAVVVVNIQNYGDYAFMIKFYGEEHIYGHLSTVPHLDKYRYDPKYESRVCYGPYLEKVHRKNIKKMAYSPFWKLTFNLPFEMEETKPQEGIRQKLNNSPLFVTRKSFVLMKGLHFKTCFP